MLQKKNNMLYKQRRVEAAGYHLDHTKKIIKKTIAAR
jgi:hypothetical protein